MTWLVRLRKQHGRGWLQKILVQRVQKWEPDGESPMALSNDEKCTMFLRIYLSMNDGWFLHKNSCLDHCNHLPIADEAMAKRANEMTDRDVSMVSYLLLSMFMYA